MEPKSKGTKLASPPEAAAAASAALIALVFGNGDLFREILLRLSLPTSLVRAAAVGKDWYKVASAPDLLRRFRALHPLPLLGFYDSEILRFVPRPHPPELAPVIRRCSSIDLGGRLVFNLYDCRNGRLLLSILGKGIVQFSVCSSLHPERGVAALPDPPCMIPDYESEDDVDDHHGDGGGEREDDDSDRGDEGYGGAYGYFVKTEDHGMLLPEDGGDALSCTSVTLKYSEKGIWAHVTVFEAGAWSEGRNSELIPRKDMPELFVDCRRFGILANGKVYRLCMKNHILVIDLQSKSMFFLKLPKGVVYDDGAAYLGVSRAEGSGIFLIHVEDLKLFVWINRMECSGGGDWELVDTVCLHQTFRDLADPTWLSLSASGACFFYVNDVGDNAEYVFLEREQQIYYMHISSRTVEKVYDEETQNEGCPFDVAPIMMVWPPTFRKLKG